MGVLNETSGLSECSIRLSKTACADVRIQPEAGIKTKIAVLFMTEHSGGGSEEREACPNSVLK